MALSPCDTKTDLHNMELTKHGNPSFPIACYHDDLSSSNVPWHWHEEWEFAIVSEGEPEFYMENFHVTIKNGDGIFLNSRALHAVIAREGRLHSAVFHPRLIGGNIDSIYWQTLVNPFMSNLSTRFIILHEDIPWEKEVLEHFENTWLSIEREIDNFENITRFELSSAIRLLVRNIDFSKSKLSERELIRAERIRESLEFIEEHFMEDITLSDISSHINVSESVVLRSFHDMLDTTPIRYLKNLRIQRASELLRTTRKSTKEIALSCGFNDMSYFTKSFKHSFSCTPSDYRKM